MWGKFEPGYQTKCLKKIQMQLNALFTAELGMTLKYEMLSKIDQEDQVEEEHRLSLHAISGTTSE